MNRYLMHHRHLARECPVAFAAWRAFASPLRGRTTVSSCFFGGHEIWWVIEAASEGDALAKLPAYVAARTTATQVGQIDIP